MIRLWVDDEREKPPEYDVWAKSYHEALPILETQQVCVVSLDYELGPSGCYTGLDIIQWILDQTLQDKINNMSIYIHTKSIACGLKMHEIRSKIDQYWKMA